MKKIKNNDYLKIEKFEKKGKEYFVDKFKLLFSSKPLPFSIKKEINISEKLENKYFYLLFRFFPKKKEIFIKKSEFIKQIYQYFFEKNFFNLETPLLSQDTREGANLFKVLGKKKNFFLPQSPQYYKHFLIYSGFRKYFQIAKCFRDEDLRDHRTYEFLQLDCEIPGDDLFFLENQVLEFLKYIFFFFWYYQISDSEI